MLNNYIVTIKLPRNPNHDPKRKLTGSCLVSKVCTDVTGEHHSYLVQSPHGIGTVLTEAKQKYGHVTRIERV